LRFLLAAAAVLLVACGSDTPTVPQAAVSAVVAGNVSVKQTGDAQVSIVPGSVGFKLDDAKLMNVTMTIRSTAPGPQTVSARASLFDAAGKIVGDATGGVLNVRPGVDTPVALSGPTPLGTIAAATVEFHLVPSPTQP
jgi:hypothetical protein